MEPVFLAAIAGLGLAVGTWQRSWLAGAAIACGIPLLLWLLSVVLEAHARWRILRRAGRDPAAPESIALLGASGFRLRESAWMSRRAAAILVDALPELRGGTRLAAAQALGRLGQRPERAVPVLIEGLSSPEGREVALDGLRLYGPAAAPAVPALVPLLVDRRSPQWWHVAKVLATIGPAAGAAVPALIEALNDSSADQVQWPARALGAIGDARAVPALERLAAHGKDERVRECAKAALSQLKAATQGGNATS